MQLRHTASHSRSEYLATVKWKRRPSVCQYQNSRYIDFLNQQMNLELGILQHYSHLLKGTKNFMQFGENHRENADSLRRLVISNQGIPDYSRKSMPFELSLLASKVGTHLGDSIANVTSVRISSHFETLLRKRYLKLLETAPSKDYSQINSLLYITNSNLINLMKFDSTQ